MEGVPQNKKLYICSHVDVDETCCYAIQSIDLEGLLRCSCGFHEDTKQALECATCKSRHEQGDSPSRDLRTRARLYDSRDEIPDLMGCGVFGSQILFLGDIEPPTGPEPQPIGPDLKPSQRLFVFDIDDDDSKEKEIDEVLRRKCRLARFRHVTGNEMVVSKHNPSTQVIFFDADKGSWITRQPHIGFEGMPFAFSDEGLVMDLKEGEDNKEKVLFSFGEYYSDIEAWRFRLADNLDDSYIEPVGYVGIKKRMACLLDVRPEGDNCHRFVNLGDGKVCFIRACATDDV